MPCLHAIFLPKQAQQETEGKILKDKAESLLIYWKLLTKFDCHNTSIANACCMLDPTLGLLMMLRAMSQSYIETLYPELEDVLVFVNRALNRFDLGHTRPNS